MIARYDLQMRRFHTGRPFPTGKRPVGRARLVTTVLTVFLGTWLLYRLLVQPMWVSALPSLLAESLSLIEMAGAVTLICLWGVVWWQRRQTPASSPLIQQLDDLYALSPLEFERYVAHLFRRRRYTVRHRGRSGDHGVDLELSNAVGRQAIVQCKRYRSTIGPDVVRELFGTLVHERANHAFLVTTADISDAARAWAQDKPMTLIDGQTLVEIASALMENVS